MWVTWKHNDINLSWPLEFDLKVDLFYEQALGWQLHIADLVANGGTAFGEDGEREGQPVTSIRHSGFAVLQICLSYFETIGYYTSDPTGSKEAFRKGVIEVFPKLADVDPNLATDFADTLYRHARCGLYHNVRTARVGLGWPPGSGAVAYQDGCVVVNPERLPKVLKAHLERFRDELLDEKNGKLREAFERQFDRDMELPNPTDRADGNRKKRGSRRSSA
jgi:hypothetical protein